MYGIPEYRLPKSVVRDEVDLLLRDRQVVGNTQLLTYVLGEFVEIVDD
jgi:hypothetical protein